MNMASYVIFIRESTRDLLELETYWQKAPAAMVGHTFKALAAYGSHEVIEGPPVEGVAILEFPSYADAKAWYDSPSYVEAREHRFKGAAYRAVIVEGFDPTRTAK
jgi:uncharacterized protein (DUF1330 family)